MIRCHGLVHAVNRSRLCSAIAGGAASSPPCSCKSGTRVHFAFLNKRLKSSLGYSRVNSTAARNGNVDHSVKKAAPGLSEQVRQLMRHNPSAVAAIVSPSSLGSLSHYPATPDKEPSFRGLLVSSLNTVTLQPQPYVSFNIREASRTWENIKAWTSFTVTGLVEQQTADIFAGVTGHLRQRRQLQLPEQEHENRSGSRGGKEGTSSTATLEGDEEVEWTSWLGEKGQVKREFGGTWWMRCEYREQLCVHVGDHMIVVGEVLEAGWTGEKSHTVSSAEEAGAGVEGKGLIYWRGRYRSLDSTE